MSCPYQIEFDDMCIRLDSLDTIPESVGQTDGRTDGRTDLS